MEITLTGRGEGSLVCRKCCFVITSIGSGTFKSTDKLGQGPSLMGLWARGEAPGETVVKVFVP